MSAALISAHCQAAGLFEKVKISVHRARFIIGGKSHPQRVERGGVIIRRSLAGGEIVIEKHAAVLVPEIFDNFFASLRGSVGPLARLVRMPEERADLLQIFFRFVEQAIEADGRKAVSVRAVRTETEAYIKAGFARAAIALVKVGRQLDAILVATGILILRCAGRAKLDIENRWKGRRLALLCADHRQMRTFLAFVSQEELRDATIVIGGIVRHFGDRSVPIIKITR